MNQANHIQGEPQTLQKIKNIFFENRTKWQRYETVCELKSFNDYEPLQMTIKLKWTEINK